MLPNPHATLLPATVSDELLKAAESRRWFPFPFRKDPFAAFLARKGQSLGVAPCQGRHLGGAMRFLQERGLDLLASRHRGLASRLSVLRKGTRLILEASHRKEAMAHTGAFKAGEPALRTFAREHYGPGGEAELEGLRQGLLYLARVLDRLSEGFIVLLEMD